MRGDCKRGLEEGIVREVWKRGLEEVIVRGDLRGDCKRGLKMLDLVL